MDNRKVFRSHRDKAKQLSLPYHTRDGFFSKVKSFFKNPSWSMRAPSPTDSEEPTTKKEVKPFNYPAPENSLRTFSRNQGAEVDQTPNKVLSEFFSRKGDKPISEVEYEGVISLLAKATSVANTPIKDSKSDKNTNSILAKNQESIALETNTSRILTTPYQQKALKKISKESSTVFSTPEYRPVYHIVNDSFTSKSGVPSVKRVYQFSGLPSPYRTRIKAPSSISRSKRSKHDISSSSLTSSKPTPKKPLSQTASTLLSMLDEKNSDNDISMEDDNIKRFSNPYADSQFKKPRNEDTSNIDNTPSKRKAAHFTAKDINTTLAFDQTEELPHKPKAAKIDIEKTEKNSPTKDSTTNEDNKDKLDSSTFQLFGSQNDNTEPNIQTAKESFSFNPPKTAVNGVSNGSSSKPQPPSEKEKGNIGVVPTLSSFNFNFSGSSKPEKTQDTTSQGTMKTGQTPFTFSATKSPALSLEISSNKMEEFAFPDIVPVHATLDQTKVQLYKNVFEF